MLKNDNPTLETFAELVKVCGYKLVITKEEVNGYEVGGDGEYEEVEEKPSVLQEIEQIKARIEALEAKNS